MTTRRSNITHEAASSSDGRRDHPRRHWSSQDTTRNDQYATAIGNNSSTRRRFSSKYVSVDHSSAYRDAMASSHGVQLQLALEEGRGKDDAPFDPFSQFLDGMGSATVGFEDDDDIEEAEYKDLRSDDDGEDDDDDDDDEDGVGGVDPIYTTTGALYRPKSERLALRAGYPSGGKFAVIRLAGFQHKVTIDDLMVVNKLKPVSAWSVGSIHTVKDHDVMLIADQDRTLVGLPGVNSAEVDVMVEEITRDKTLVVFKKRRRKNSRRKNGFRRQVTFLRVLDVRMPTEITKISESKRVDLVDEDVRVAA
jgi:large subunit ribosomal protein L21